MLTGFKYTAYARFFFFLGGGGWGWVNLYVGNTLDDCFSCFILCLPTFLILACLFSNGGIEWSINHQCCFYLN